MGEITNDTPVETESGSEQESSEQGSPEQSAAPDLQNAVEAALENGASKQEVQNMIKKYQLKINGKMVEREVDLGNDDYIRNQLQLAEVSKIKMQEAAELKKLYEREVGRLKSSPFDVLKELGLDPDELAEMRIQQRIEEMKKSPEQVEREKITKELAEARAEAKKLKEEKESAQYERMKEAAAMEIESEIEKALDAHKTLPKSKHVAKRIADSMFWAMNNGYEDITPEDVIPLVEKELQDELNQFYNDLPDEFLEKFLGQKTSERLRSKRLKTLKDVPVNTLNQIKPTVSSVKSKEVPKEANKLKQRDFFRKVGRK